MLKYLILGAGPTGLSIANRLLENGEESFLVLEKCGEAGGLCKSTMVDGSPFDICGIHLLESGNDIARDFLFQFMPEEEWNQFHWEGKIFIDGQYIDSPFESNIWQFDIEKQIRYLKDISQSGSSMGAKMPESFEEWVYWKFGKSIADDYMIPYNKKMFHGLLNQVGTYWLYKLPDVSFEETFRSCLEKKMYGKLPGYGKHSFYYPKKYGYGEVWSRMAAKLGDKILYNIAVESIDFDKLIVNGEYQAETIITSIPWTDVKQLKNMPENLKEDIKKLKYTSVRLEYKEDELDTDAAWVYFPDSKVSYHRTMCRSVFCKGAKGHGTETNIAVEPVPQSETYFVNDYTYPVSTIEKPRIMERLLSWCEKKNVIGTGRWGEWCHHNSDVVVKNGIELADKLCKKVQ